MYTALKYLVFLGFSGLIAFVWVTAPSKLADTAFAGLSGDATRGEEVFWTGGCASCHAAPKAEGEDKLVLAGGRAFASDFGTFYAPNISMDPTHGIGHWSVQDLGNAMLKGTSPEGAHYYPAFPYTSYARASEQGVIDLFTYWQPLPASAQPSRAHDVGLPFSIRRLLGGWKFLFGGAGAVVTADLSPQQVRGQNIVEGLGHCGECHSPRNALGGVDKTRWLGGADNPSGQGKIPNITPAALDWSEADIAEYLNSGFTPEFDSAGGEMADVVENMSKLAPEDRAAIAAYLKVVPAVAPLN